VTRSVTHATASLVAYPEPPTTLGSYRSAGIVIDPDGRSVMFDTNEAECEAVLPFTLCRSNGGPYDDDAFLSGWRLGVLDATLAALGVSALADSIRPVEYAQADLIAMARGYTMDAEPSRDPGWLSVTFTRVQDDS
jgi:hypothetical protein